MRVNNRSVPWKSVTEYTTKLHKLWLLWQRDLFSYTTSHNINPRSNQLPRYTKWSKGQRWYQKEARQPRTHSFFILSIVYWKKKPIMLNTFTKSKALSSTFLAATKSGRAQFMKNLGTQSRKI